MGYVALATSFLLSYSFIAQLLPLRRPQRDLSTDSAPDYSMHKIHQFHRNPWNVYLLTEMLLGCESNTSPILFLKEWCIELKDYLAV